MPLHSEAIKSRKVNLQLLYIIFCWFITAIALFLYSSFLQNFIPSSNFQLELLIAGGQLLYMGMFLADKNKTILLDYLRNLMTVSLLGAIALLFMSLISMFIHFTPIIYLLYFMFMAAAMFLILTRKHQANSKNLQYVIWDGKTLGSWKKALEDATAVINLNGKSVDCRYTEKNKALIYSSRLDATHALGKAITQCKCKPKVWINAASATIYPHSLDAPMEESYDKFDNDFSADVCKKWEASFHQYEIPGVRKILLRTSIVLGRGKNSAFNPLKRLTQVGLGGKFGKGNQMMSWLHEDDFINIVHFCIENLHVSGTINTTAPKPVTNYQFMKVLRKALSIPFGIPTSEMMLTIGGCMIGTEPELILKSRFVVPSKLLASGFTFRYPTIEKALKNLC